MKISIASQAGAALLNALLSLALMLALARTLGPDEFGNYSSTLNLGVIALTLIEGGYPLLIYRETVAPSARYGINPPILLSIGTGHAAVTVSLLALLPLRRSPIPPTTIWWSLLAVMTLVAWMNIQSAHLRGYGAFAEEAAWQVGGRLLSLLVILLALALDVKDSQGIFLAWAAGLVLYLMLHPRRQSVTLAFASVPTIRHDALHLMIGTLLAVSLLRIDVVLLDKLGGNPVQTAYYSAAVRFAEGGLLCFSPVINILLLELRRRAFETARFGRFVIWTTAGAATFATLGTALAAMAAEPLIALAFGTSYAPASSLLPWAVATLIPLLPSQVLGQAVIARNREAAVWLATAIGIVVAVLGAVIWVPVQGGLGMAKAILVAHSVVVAILAGILLLDRRTHLGDND